MRTLSTQTEAHSASGSERPGDTDNVHTVPTTGGIPITQDSTAGWQRRYSRRLLLSDAIILVFVVFGAQIIWFDNGQARLNILRDTRISDISYWIFSAILILAWLWALSLADSRSRRVIGTGTTEYRRVVDPSLRVFGLIAILAFLLQIDVARGYLLISLPSGVALLVLSRWLWRQWLLTKRRRGGYMARVLLVGSERSVAYVGRELQRTPSAGYKVVGACLPSGKHSPTVAGTDIQVIGDVDVIARALRATGADTVAITGADDLPPAKVKQISWDLEAGRQHLVLAPSIADIAGPRMHMRPVSGLPLVHVETPRFSLGQRFVKRMVDLSLALVGVVLISPILGLLALSIRLSTPGPVLFRQTRVGYRGQEFTMLKFRSMVPNAEDLLADLRAQDRDSGNEVLFKMKDDPRVTPTGRFMRKYSLDELPQLFNVIGGSMSLIGPRPPLPSEVEQYADHVHRRFLVKPGITGLWQVSGRSSLSWEESVRLDPSYVENWSLVSAVTILLKTAKAALAPGDTAH